MTSVASSLLDDDYSSANNNNNTPSSSGGARHSIHHHLVARKRKPVSQDYDILDQIGEGYIGRIYVATHKSSSSPVVRNTKTARTAASRSSTSTSTNKNNSNNKYAIKEIYIELVDEESLDMMRNEIGLLMTMDHPNIVRAFAVYEDPTTSNISIVMEYCSGGDLYQRAPYTELEVKLIAAKLAEAMNYLHSNCNIIHRDMKCENVLFEDETHDAQIKIIDFGLSCKFHKGENVIGRVGTWYTMSPEQVRGEYDSKADMWAIGVIVYILLSGEKPFWTARQAADGEYSFDGPAWKDVSAEAKDLIRNLLQVDLAQRYSAQQALESAWLQPFTNPHRSASRLSASVVTRLYNDLGHFSSENEFRKLAMQAIAKKATLNEIVELRDIFHELDHEHDGTISLQDLKEALLVAEQYSPDEVELVFRGVDVGEDGELDYTGFLAATLESYVRIEGQRIAEAFEMFDPEEKGYITSNDLREILGTRVDDKYIEHLIQGADRDGDGKITFEDFNEVFEKKESERFERLSLGEPGAPK